MKSHQYKIAMSTLKMSEIGANLMGGMNHAEAISFLLSDGMTQAKISNILLKAGHDKERVENKLNK